MSETFFGQLRKDLQICLTAGAPKEVTARIYALVEAEFDRIEKELLKRNKEEAEQVTKDAADGLEKFMREHIGACNAFGDAHKIVKGISTHNKAS